MASLQAETIFHIGSFPVSNSLITATVVTILLVLISFIYYKKSSLVPTKFTALVEMLIEFLWNTIEGIAGKKAKIYFPLCATFFIMIITNNYFALLPFVGPIGIKDVVNGKEVLIPIFRSINADLNGTVVLALVSVVMTHFFAIRSVGIYHHIARYIPFIGIRWKDINSVKKFFSAIWWNFIYLFVGILELISEFVKIISLSFRLFGNIFAGEVVLGTVSGLLVFSAFIIPLPFMALEIIVGYVQATVFMLLTVVFMTVLSEIHGGEELNEENH